MGAFIAKQPNGLYCRFSTVVDCPTDWNMTEEDYIEMCKKNAEEQARKVLSNTKPFEWVTEYFKPYNMTKEEFEAFLNDTNTSTEHNETAQEEQSFIDAVENELICNDNYCPYFKEHKHSPQLPNCEGSYCEEAWEEYKESLEGDSQNEKVAKEGKGTRQSV